MHCHFLIYLSIDGHLGCFHILAIVNYAIINLRVPIFFQISVLGFFEYIPISEIAGSKKHVCLPIVQV